MPKSIRAWLLASVSVLGAAPALAQTPAAADEDDVITVRAARVATPQRALPNRVGIISREELAEQLAVSTSLLDAVSMQTPSFSPTREKLTGAGETMRGREPLYMIDGVPQSNPLRNGGRDGFTLDPAVIQRVEVLYGANAIQGIGGTGGIINYVTLTPPQDEFAVRSELSVTASDGFEGDSFGYRGAVTALRDFGVFDMVVSAAGETRGAFYDAEGRRVGIENVQGDLQDSQSLNLFGKFGLDLDRDTRVQLTVNVFDIDGDGDYVEVAGDRTTGLPTSATRGSFPGEPPFNKVRTASLDITRDNLFGGSLSAQAFYQDFEAVYGGGTFATFQDTSIAPDGTLFDQSGNNSEKRGVKLAYSHEDLPLAGLSAVAGLDYLQDETTQVLVQTNREWVPETKFESWAPFLQLNQDLLDNRLHLSAGVRVEDATLDVDTYTTLASYGPVTVQGGGPGFSETLWNAGAAFDMTPWLTGYASYAEGFTMPDVGRVLRGVTDPAADVDTLLDLQPIVADNMEVGLKFDNGRLRGDVGYFWSESDFGQRLVAGPDGIFSVNREKTEIEGLEASAEFDATAALTVGASLALLDGRFDSDGDNDVDSDLGGRNISPDRVNLYAGWNPQGSAFDALIQTRFYLDKEFDTGGAFDGYMLVDARVGYELGEYGRLDLGVQNLLDEQYITYFSQTATSGPDDYYAGRGRTLTLRWSGAF